MELTLRSSGAPQSLLHKIYEKPTGHPGTYSHPRSPTLDTGNSCTRASMRKGFSRNSCFAFDVFSRRTITRSESGLSRSTIWDIDREWNEEWEQLHHQYRQFGGGAITMVFGQIAFQSYLSVVKREEMSLQRLNENQPCGYAVFLERSKGRLP